MTISELISLNQAWRPSTRLLILDIKGTEVSIKPTSNRADLLSLEVLGFYENEIYVEKLAINSNVNLGRKVEKITTKDLVDSCNANFPPKCEGCKNILFCQKYLQEFGTTPYLENTRRYKPNMYSEKHVIRVVV